jgi:hypothetical protein
VVFDRGIFWSGRSRDSVGGAGAYLLAEARGEDLEAAGGFWR